ncbi:unnamed protein product [Dicrocoelium dendriticum]|nr:unnamed protein product [Dicrocoelium dendriticum]
MCGGGRLAVGRGRRWVFLRGGASATGGGRAGGGGLWGSWAWAGRVAAQGVRVVAARGLVGQRGGVCGREQRGRNCGCGGSCWSPAWTGCGWGCVLVGGGEGAAEAAVAPALLGRVGSCPAGAVLSGVPCGGSCRCRPADGGVGVAVVGTAGGHCDCVGGGVGGGGARLEPDCLGAGGGEELRGGNAGGRDRFVVGVVIGGTAAAADNSCGRFQRGGW